MNERAPNSVSKTPATATTRDRQPGHSFYAPQHAAVHHTVEEGMPWPKESHWTLASSSCCAAAAEEPEQELEQEQAPPTAVSKHLSNRPLPARQVLRGQGYDRAEGGPRAEPTSPREKLKERIRSGRF